MRNIYDYVGYMKRVD